MNKEDFIKEFTKYEDVFGRYDIDSITLAGSLANGKFIEGWSDIDIVVLMKEFSGELNDVARYKSFSEMMSKEEPKKINPYSSPEEQLREIRKIFPPEKEKLGVIAFELAAV